MGVLILESVVSEFVPADWKFSVCHWPTCFVKVDGMSLFDLKRAFEEESLASGNDVREGHRWQYNTTRVRGRKCSDRLERLISDEAIFEVVSKTCCMRRCTQRISLEVVKSLRYEMWSSDHKLRSRIILEVHRHVCRGGDWKYVVLKNDDVCLKG